MTPAEALYAVIAFCFAVFLFCCWVVARDLHQRSRRKRIDPDVPVFRTDETVRLK